MRHLLRASLVILALAGTVRGQLPRPRLDTIFPPGGKAGSQIEVQVAGSELEGASRIYFSHPSISAIPKRSPPDEVDPYGRPMADWFIVNIADGVGPGIYEARVFGRFGLSNPRAFVVGNLPELADNDLADNGKNGKNHTPQTAMPVRVGTILNGRCDEGQVDYYRVSLAKDQHVVFDCWSQRVDSRLDPTLLLYNSSGVEMLRVGDADRQDPVLDFQAPEDGQYLLAVYDLVYRGGPEFPYRLVIHGGAFVDYVFPPVGQSGMSGKFAVFGRYLEGGKPLDAISADGRPLERLDLDVTLSRGDPQGFAAATVVPVHGIAIDRMSLPIPGVKTKVSAATVARAIAPVVLEVPVADESDAVQRITPPCEYVARFFPRGDHDTVSFQANNGDVWWLEVVSHRMGMETDPRMVVEKITTDDQGNEQVSKVADVDDGHTHQDNAQPPFDMRSNDPVYRLQADADAIYRVTVSDLFGGLVDDPRRFYRLVIRKSRYDFRLLAFPLPRGNPAEQQFEPAETVLYRGGASAMTVKIDRQHGFEEEISIAAEGLPSGVHCQGAVANRHVGSVALVFTADEDAASWAGPIRVVGRSLINGTSVKRYARAGALVWPTANKNEYPIARLTRDLVLAVVENETAPATVSIGDGNLVETSLGGKVELPIRVVRRGGFDGELALTTIGMPDELKPKDTSIKESDGKLELLVNNIKAPLSTFTFFMRGTSKIQYARVTPEILGRAEQEQKRLDQLLGQFQEKSNEAAGLQTRAQEEAAKDPENQELSAKAKAAEQEAIRAAELVKKAESRKGEADKRVTELKEAKPQELNLSVVSTPVRIRVHQRPVNLKLDVPGKLKQGETIQIPISIERKFGFDGQVEFQFEPAGGASGLAPKPLVIPKGQVHGNLELAAAPDAAPGEFPCRVKLNLSFNDVALESSDPIRLVVEAVDSEDDG